MQVQHPLATREASPPAAVTAPDGATYPVGSDGLVDCPDAIASALADALARQYDEPPDGLLVPEPDTCEAITNSGAVCGRERPCRYHDDTDTGTGTGTDTDTDTEA